MFPEAQCKELIEKLERGGDQKSEAMLFTKEQTLHLAFDAAGCRVVQAALAAANKHEASEIASGLRTHIIDAAVCPHGNYVVQKIVEILPVSRAEFVAEELKDVVFNMARHPYACRVLCRLLEHCAAAPHTISLIDDLLKHADELLNHMYGHYVLELTLQHGSPQHKSSIVAVLLSRLEFAAQQYHASHVCIMALRVCCDADRQALLNGFVQNDILANLSLHKRGCKVVKMLLHVPQQEAESVVAKLLQCVQQMEQSRFSRQVLQELKSQGWL